MDVSHDIVSQRLVDAPLCTLYALDFFISRGAFTVAEEIQRFLGQKVTAQLYEKTDGSPSVLLRSAIFNLKRYFMKNEHKKDGIRDDLEISLAHLVESAPEARRKASFQQFLLSFLSCRLLGLLLQDPSNRDAFIEEYDVIFNHKSKSEVYLGKHLTKPTKKALRVVLAPYAEAEDDDIDLHRAAKFFKLFSNQVAKDVHEALDPILLGLGQGPLFELLLPVQRRLEHGGYETDLSSSDSDEPMARHKSRTPHRKSLSSSYTPLTRSLRTPSSSHMSGLATALAAATSSSKSAKKKSSERTASTPQRRLRLISSSESESSSSESSSEAMASRRPKHHSEKRKERTSHIASTPVPRSLSKPHTPVSRTPSTTKQPRQPLDEDDDEDNIIRFTSSRGAASGPASRRESDIFATQFDFGQNDVRFDQNEHEYTTPAFGEPTEPISATNTSVDPSNTSMILTSADLAPISAATAPSSKAMATGKATASTTASTTSTAAAAPKVTASSNSMDISEVESTSVNPRATNGTRVAPDATRPGKRRGSQLVDTQDDQPLAPNPAKRVSEGVEDSANDVANPPAAAPAPRATAAAPAEQRHRAPFSIEEDAFLRTCYAKYGNKYANIFYAGQTHGLFLGRTQVSLKDRIRTLSKHQTLVSGDQPIPNEPKWQRPSRLTPQAIASAFLSAEAAVASLEAGEPLPTAPGAKSTSAKSTSAKSSSAKSSSAKTTSVGTSDRMTRSSLAGRTKPNRKAPTKRVRDEETDEFESARATESEEEFEIDPESGEDVDVSESENTSDQDSDDEQSDEQYKLDEELLELVPDHHVVRQPKAVASVKISPNKRKLDDKHKSDEEPKSDSEDEPKKPEEDKSEGEPEPLESTPSHSTRIASRPKTVAAKRGGTVIVLKSSKGAAKEKTVGSSASAKRKVSKKPTHRPDVPLVESSSESDDAIEGRKPQAPPKRFTRSSKASK